MFHFKFITNNSSPVNFYLLWKNYSEKYFYTSLFLQSKYVENYIYALKYLPIF